MTEDFQSELEHLQKKLDDVEARYRALIESEHLFICRLTPDGALRYANQAYLSFLKAVSLPVEKHNFLSDLSEGQADEVMASVHHLSPDNSEFTFASSLRLLEGGTNWQQWSCRGFFNGNGSLEEIQAVGHDITAIKQAEMAAEQHNRQLSALHAATRALLNTLDSETLLGQILDAAIIAVPIAEMGTLHLIARDTGQLELRASIGYSDPRIKKFSYAESSGYVARSVRERRPLLFTDTADHLAKPRGELISEVDAVRSALVAPLMLQDRILGAVSLESSAPSAFTEADLRLLVSFAATATNAIHNAELHTEVQKLAITDALTGLYNRRGFYELGQREIERSFRFKHPLTAVMLDVDNFKYINDTYGHGTGDVVLRSIAIRCTKLLRKVDILGRYGGDEFIILLPETHVRLGALAADRLSRLIAETQIPTERELLQVTITIGVAGLTTEVTDLDSLIRLADKAMYAARRTNLKSPALPL